MNRPEIPSFAVVVPAYNEEAGIEACITAVGDVLTELPNRAMLIVVDDGSADGTTRRLSQLAPIRPWLVLLRHPENRGYGAALRTGTRAAEERGLEYVVFMDSDLTNDPRYLRGFAAAMGNGIDVIKASRYAVGGGTSGVPTWRVALSLAGNLVARLLFRLPIRDCTNGFRAVRTGLLTSIDLQENSFAIIMEELYKLRPLARTYGEVPIVLTARRDGLTPSRFSLGPGAMLSYLRYPLLSARDRLSQRSA
jgi:dolichol-phosphate mannosyltransferase